MPPGWQPSGTARTAKHASRWPNTDVRSGLADHDRFLAAIIDLLATGQCPGGPRMEAEHRNSSANGLDSPMVNTSYQIVA